MEVYGRDTLSGTGTLHQKKGSSGVCAGGGMMLVDLAGFANLDLAKSAKIAKKAYCLYLVVQFFFAYFALFARITTALSLFLCVLCDLCENPNQ